jgi:hypothetical protein
MCITTNSSTTTTETLCPPHTLLNHQKHFALLMTRREHLPILLSFIKQLIARYSEHFLLFRSTTHQSTMPSGNLYNEPPTEKHPDCKTQISKRRRSPLHIRLRQRLSETMPDQIDKDAEPKLRSDNHFFQIDTRKDHFLSIIPSEFVYYQLTIHCRRDKLNNAAYHADRIKDVIDTVYKRINEKFVHKRRYAQMPHKQLMPYLLAMIEADNKVMFHAHCVLAVHPDTAEAFDQLRIWDKFQQFDPRISSSHFNRLIADAIDIKEFYEPTNLSKWVNYMLKKNRNPNIVKRPDHLLTLAPKH